MNKINEKQKEIIKFFQKQLSFWEKTNDIDSPTHYTDISEELRVLNDNLAVDYTSLTPYEIDDIESVTRTLYQIIAKIQK